MTTPKLQAPIPLVLTRRPAQNLIRQTTVANPDRPEERPLSARRDGYYVDYELGLRSERRRYTSAAIAKRVVELVAWWHERRDQYIVTDLLGWLIRASEESAVAEIYAQSLLRSGSCFAKIPPRFDTM